MIKVIVKNKTRKCFFRKKLFKKVANEVAKMENIEIYSEINVIIVDNEEIKNISSQYRNKDQPTDVLSFPNDYQELYKYLNYYMLGDIYISFEQIAMQAKKFNHSKKREWAYIFCHGFLHVLGYDHIVAEEEKIMNNKTKQIMDILKIKR